MVDFAQARRTMVDCQVRTSDVTDLRVIAALLDVAARAIRARGAASAIAYLDRDVPVNDEPAARAAEADGVRQAAAGGRRSPRPTACSMSAAPRGYSSAVLGKLAARVVALEEDAALAATAAEALAASGARNVAVASGTLSAGWPDEATLRRDRAAGRERDRA